MFLLACGGAPGGEAVDGGADVAATSGADVARPSGLGNVEPAPENRPGGGEEELGLGPGFVVWESNRGGAWRIWIRDLAGGRPRRLSSDEPGRDHCCPHISPDGRRVSYISGSGGGREYPPDGFLGELRVIAPDGTGDLVVAPVARSYFENRAVVWRSPRELIHIDGDRATMLLDLDNGTSRRLTDPPAERGWLIDATLSWATTGRPEFALYDAGRRAIVPRRRLGGCQPFFSRDGRWGYWTAGAGGPIDRVDRAGDRRGRILNKNDSRVPDGFGYAYFPMSSADGRLFAWAASQGGHDHFRTDYEVFVAESDPDTLELIGPPSRITRHPSTDRFPDVWQPPLDLGRHAGEAPFTARFEAPSAGEWEWAFGESGAPSGPAAAHTWERPGRYRVSARLGDRVLRGLVVVRPALPPRVLRVTARAGGRELIVTFDERVDATEARLTLSPDGAIAGWELGPDGSRLVVSLAEPLREAVSLTVSGVRDRARVANVMAPATLAVEPPAWPASRDGLVFLWETADAANLVPDPELGADRTYTLAPSGRARLDAHFAMLTGGGAFALDASQAAGPSAAVKATNELSIEATLVAGGDDGGIFAWAGEKAINMWLEQRAGRLVMVLRTGARGPQAYPRVDLFELPSGAPVHVVATYEPGRLVAYRDGRQVLDTAEVQNGFYHWRALPLRIGDGAWRGRIEGVAIYDRVLRGDEAAEAYRLYRAKREARQPVPRTVVEARPVARSRTPTLAEITPYREALVTVDYAVESRLEGPPVADRLRAAQWAILDGASLDVDRAAAGGRLRLTLEPFADQPQLESVYLADTLAGDGGDLFYVVDATAAR